MRFLFVLPQGQGTNRGGRPLIVISPDGENIVYQANRQLYLRSMSDVDARPIEGTNLDAADPFFSPDGKWIGFYAVAERKLKKIAITGGAAVTVSEVDFPIGASWTADDQILLADPQKGILRVSANGGKAETLIAAKGDEAMDSLQLLPDRDHLLFTVRSAVGARDIGVGRDLGASTWDKAQIVVQSLKSGERKTLIEGGADGRYVPTGHLVYALGSTLLAVPFNTAKLERTGGPVPVTEGVARAAFNASGTAQFSFAANGTMVYFVGNTSPFQETKVALVDRDGKAKPLPLPAGRYYSEPRVSPDGKQAAVMSADDQGTSVSLYELSQAAALRRLTFQSADHPVWTRDGQRIIFDSDGSLFWQRADGTGTAEQLAKTQGPGSYTPNSVSPDGKTLLFRAFMNAGDIWSLSLDADHKQKSLISGEGNQTHAYFSPDGRWTVYASVEPGQAPNLFVQPFPPTGAKYQITTTGAISPLWSPDGKQIFYMGSSGDTRQLSSVDVHTQPSFGFANPTKLSIDKIPQRVGTVRQYDITPDGKQFLIVYRDSITPDQPLQTQIRITLNWFEELKRRVR